MADERARREQITKAHGIQGGTRTASSSDKLVSCLFLLVHRAKYIGFIAEHAHMASGPLTETLLLYRQQNMLSHVDDGLCWVMTNSLRNRNEHEVHRKKLAK